MQEKNDNTNKLAIRAMYDWMKLWEKVFLTAWSRIVSYNQTMKYKCGTLQRYYNVF